MIITNEFTFPETDTQLKEMCFLMIRIVSKVVQGVGLTQC